MLSSNRLAQTANNHIEETKPPPHMALLGMAIHVHTNIKHTHNHKPSHTNIIRRKTSR